MSWSLFAQLITAGSAAAAQPAVQPAAVEQNDEAALELTQAEIIALETERYRRLTVPVTIQGEGPFRFLVDTGAQATVLSRDLADTLGLQERSNIRLVAMASARVVEAALVPEMALGSRAFSVRKAPIIEANNIGDADGILGIDSLQDQRVLFDFENRQLAVAEARELGGDRGFDIVVRARRTLGQLIIHRARVDGINVAVIIDTGAQGSVGNMALERKMRSVDRATGAMVMDINGTETFGNVKYARSLSMGRAQINNCPIVFTDGPTFEELGLADEPAMVLGMSELHLFRRVAIDFDKRRILFDLPEDADIGSIRLFNGSARLRW